MPPTIRKPGFQAPPPRPTHRNPGPTASTHVKSTAGTFCIWDSASQTIIEHNGQPFSGLSYDDARRARDFAVTRLKFRKASIREEAYEPAPEETLHDQVEALPSNGSYVDPHPTKAVIADAPNPDPELEAQRQRALAAARPVAQQAQARAATAAKTPPRPPVPQKPKLAGKPVQRAPGWEPPPAGVTQARQAPKPPPKDAPAVRAPGFEAPKGGAKSAAPEAVAAVDLNPIEGDDSVELDASAIDDANVADVLSGPDLETDVKQAVTETENKVIEACKTLKVGEAVYYFPDDTDDSITAKVVAVHAPTCITLQLPSETDELVLKEHEPGKAFVESQLTGQVLKSVMLSPQQGKRAGTWQPIL